LKLFASHTSAQVHVVVGLAALGGGRRDGQRGSEDNHALHDGDGISTQTLVSGKVRPFLYTPFPIYVRALQPSQALNKTKASAVQCGQRRQCALLGLALFGNLPVEISSCPGTIGKIFCFIYHK
jgi:hypothetical protein